MRHLVFIDGVGTFAIWRSTRDVAQNKKNGSRDDESRHGVVRDRFDSRISFRDTKRRTVDRAVAARFAGDNGNAFQNRFDRLSWKFERGRESAKNPRANSAARRIRAVVKDAFGK